MHKNQLQELAQRSNVNLPAYSCIREGPDHAPRFKAMVNFDGEVFESPQFYSTLRQAEHAAAEAALDLLSKRGTSQSLAARVLEETGMCKNLLQESAQKAGVSLPMYTTIKGAPGHGKNFTSIVQVGGRVYAGEPAKSRKQAEKNAAMAALSGMTQLTQHSRRSDGEGSSRNPDRFDRSNSIKSTLLPVGLGDGKSQLKNDIRASFPGVQMVNPRDPNRSNRDARPHGQCLSANEYHAPSSVRESGCKSHRFFFPNDSRSMSRAGHSRHQSHLLEHFHVWPSSKESSYESQRFLFNQQPHTTAGGLAELGSISYQKTSSSVGQDMIGSSMRSSSSGGHIAIPSLLQGHDPKGSHVSLQSSSDHIRLHSPSMEELQLQAKDQTAEWYSTGGTTASVMQQPHCFREQEQLVQPLDLWHSSLPRRRAHSERFDLKPRLLDELHRDEEEWWSRGDMLHQGMGKLAISESRVDLKQSLLDEEWWSRGDMLHQGMGKLAISESRVDLKQSLLDEAYRRNKDEWGSRADMLLVGREKSFSDGRHTVNYLFHNKNKDSYDNMSYIPDSEKPGNVDGSCKRSSYASYDLSHGNRTTMVRYDKNPDDSFNSRFTMPAKGVNRIATYGGLCNTSEIPADHRNTASSSRNVHGGEEAIRPFFALGLPQCAQLSESSPSGYTDVVQRDPSACGQRIIAERPVTHSQPKVEVLPNTRVTIQSLKSYSSSNRNPLDDAEACTRDVLEHLNLSLE
ncbi:hypothetical protein KP509_12G009400 [Ceratopteris richardii]|uniref:DRBM domain-containing protein n=1 Tax=Ceratopteris richardii TaxID=49495 RepID=A0A8T2TLY4_CERRI|nr:hypothetical protein KP509_12G009400 [Ceratopteris richardii]